MSRKFLIPLALCCLMLASCTTQSKSYLNEAKSKPVEARAGQEFSQYALYSPELTATLGIEAEDIFYAAGTFRLLNPTLAKLESLSNNKNITLYYNQAGHVIIEIKDK